MNALEPKQHKINKSLKYKHDLFIDPIPFFHAFFSFLVKQILKDVLGKRLKMVELETDIIDHKKN